MRFVERFRSETEGVDRLCDQAPGYAVSLVTAASRLRGMPAGPLHAPLTGLGPAGLVGREDILGAGG
jgi:5-dehydro-4-deoxyglucarate dehydratase